MSQGRTALVVDDDEGLAQIVAVILRIEGFEVRIADNGAHGFAAGQIGVVAYCIMVSLFLGTESPSTALYLSVCCLLASHVWSWHVCQTKLPSVLFRINGYSGYVPSILTTEGCIQIDVPEPMGSGPWRQYRSQLGLSALITLLYGVLVVVLAVVLRFTVFAHTSGA